MKVRQPYFRAVLRIARRAWQAGTLLLLLVGMAGAQPVEFQHFDQEDGLPDGQINAIHQEARGFVWLATPNGLARYDGTGFTIFRNEVDYPGALPDNNINCIASDAAGHLWMGSEYEGLIAFDRTQETFTSFWPESPGEAPTRAVTCLLEWGESALLVGTRQGLFRFQISDQTFSPIPLAGAAVREITALQRVRETVYIGTSAGLFALAEDADLANPIPQSPTLRINALWKQPQGDLFLIGADQGLFELNLRDGVIARPQKISWPENIPISTFADCREDHLWMGTFGEGLFLFNYQSNQSRNFRNSPDNPASLSGNDILSLYMSPTGQLWAGTYQAGLNLLSYNQTAFAFFPAGAPGGAPNGVNTIAGEFKNSMLWLGTDDGLFRQDIASELLEYNDLRRATNLPTVPVYAMLPGGKNPMLLGTGGGGLLRCDNPHAAMADLRFEKVPGLQSDEILALDARSGDGVWIGSVAGIDVWNLGNDSIRSYRKGEKGLGEGEITVLQGSPDNSVWVGTSQNLFRYDADRDTFLFVPLRSSDPNRLLYIFDIYHDPENGTWVGTDDGLQLISQNGDSVQRWTKADGLPGNEVVAILRTSRSKPTATKVTWVTCNHGIAELSQYDPNWKISGFTRRDGLPCRAFNPGAILSYGDLYLGGAEGLVWFDPAHIFTPPSNPTIQITDFRLHNAPVPFRDAPGSPLHQPIWETDSLLLAPEQNHLHFAFSSMYFRPGGRPEYAYQLRGFDSAWVEAGPRNTATYTNLEPGDYTFQLKTPGQSQIARQLFIRISEVETEGAWLYFVLIIFGAAALILIVRWNRRRD